MMYDGGQQRASLDTDNATTSNIEWLVMDTNRPCNGALQYMINGMRTRLITSSINNSRLHIEGPLRKNQRGGVVVCLSVPANT